MQKNYGLKILSLGASLPKKVVTNHDLEKLFDTSDEWIFSRTGIKERRVLDKDESGLTLSIAAAKEALEKASVSPGEIDLVIVATCTPDKFYPSMACMLQGAIGAKNAVAFDLSAACSGFVFGLITAAQYIYNGTFKTVLLIGVDVHSRFIDWSERNVSVLFGDGAGAVILKGTLARDDELLGYEMFSRSDVNFDLCLDNKNVLFGEFKKTIDPNFVKMNGKAIYQFACEEVPNTINLLLDKINLKASDIDYFFLHQANKRIIDSVAKKLNLNESQIISNIKNVGNTSSASIPLVMSYALDSKLLKSPSRIMIVGFGAGLTWGSAVINWNI